jgi:integrase
VPKLTDKAIAATKPREKAFRLSDGEGLLLEVQPSGKRTWLFRFMLLGRRRDMGLGAYPAVSLADARKAARGAAAHVEARRDPIAERERAVRERAEQDRLEEAAQARTFRDVAERLIAAQAPGWTSPRTKASWDWTMDRYAFPALGSIPVADVTREDVVRCLTPIWASLPPAAAKVQRRVAAILDYASALGWRTAANPATGRVLRLTKALPAQRPGRQQPSLPWQKVPALMTVLAGMEGVGPLCLRWAVFSTVRSAEARGARWNEIELEAGLWVVPSERMKGGRRRALAAHRVPLTPPMLELLARAAALRTGEEVPPDKLLKVVPLLGNGLIFPARAGGVLSDMSLSAVLRRLNAARPTGAPLLWCDADGRATVPHGLRRSFRTWVDDTRPEAGEAAEKALAHDDANAVRAAYRGSDMLDQRRGLMAAWANHCTSAKSASIDTFKVRRVG